MKRYFAIIAVLAITFISINDANANNKSIGADVGLAIPVGDFSNEDGRGFGIEAKAIVPINQNFAFGASLGYYSWSSKENFGYEFPSSNIPITITLMYFVSQSPTRFYVAIDLSGNNLSFTVEKGGFGESGTETNTTKGPGIAPLVGIVAPIGENTNITGTLKYNIIWGQVTRYEFISIRAGIMFLLGGSRGGSRH